MNYVVGKIYCLISDLLVESIFRFQPLSICLSFLVIMNGKKVSPKNRRVSEQYKSRHNVGRRSAVEKVASYHESDVNVAYPAGFWDDVKVEPHDSYSDSGSSHSDSELSDPEPEGPMVSSDPDSDSSEEVTFKQKLENGKTNNDKVGTQRLPRVARPPSMIDCEKGAEKTEVNGSYGNKEYDFKGTSSESSAGESEFCSDDSEQNSHSSDEDYTYTAPVKKPKVTCYGSPLKDSHTDKAKKSIGIQVIANLFHCLHSSFI